MDFYVYIHRKKINGEVFYVGKGSGNRAWAKHGRSLFWKRVVAKHDYTVEIVINGVQEWFAFEHEKSLIAYYGMRKDGCGTLVNSSEGLDTVYEHAMDKNKYNFINYKTFETFYGTRRDFKNKYKIDPRSIVTGGNLTVGNWSLLSTFEKYQKKILTLKNSAETNPRFDDKLYCFYHYYTREIKFATKYEMSLIEPRIVVLFGKRNPVFVNNWSLFNDNRRFSSKPKFSQAVYTFKHTSGEIFIGTRTSLRLKYGVCVRVMFSSSRKVKSVKGWSLVDNESLEITQPT